MSDGNMEDKNQTVFKEEVNNDTEQSEDTQTKTSSGLDENVASLLCYLVTFITGIIFLVIEKDNQTVRFHAMQSIVTFASIFILSFVLTMIPFIGWLIGLLITPLSIILWIVLMYKAYKGQMFKLPIIGDFAEKQVNQMKGKS